MKNPDLLTIGSIIISVALLAMATVLLLNGVITFTNGGIYFLGLVAAINGFTGALKAPSAQQATDLVNALAASGPVNAGPLVQIHTTPASTQVSAAALPLQSASSQLMNTPLPMVQQGFANMPQGTVVQTGQGMLLTPSDQSLLPQGPTIQSAVPWQIQPPVPQGTAPYQVDRNWTGLVPTVPPGAQPTQQ